MTILSSRDDIKVVAVVQCAIALERCSGFNCALAFHSRSNHFKNYLDEAIYVPFSCGGCPGRRVSRLISNLKKGAAKRKGIDKKDIAIHLSACIVTDNGHYPECPFKNYMKSIISQKGFKVIEGSYESCGPAKRKIIATHSQSLI